MLSTYPPFIAWIKYSISSFSLRGGFTLYSTSFVKAIWWGDTSQVTLWPFSFALMIYSIDSLVLTWEKWTLHPACFAKVIFLQVIVFSASLISMSDKLWFSQWHITVISFSLALIIAFNITSLCITSFPSSDITFISPFFSLSKWLMSSPLNSLVIDITWLISISPTSLPLFIT